MLFCKRFFRRLTLSLILKDIFREEMKPVYAQKTKYRDTLNQTARELLHLDALQNSVRDAPMGGLCCFAYGKAAEIKRYLTHKRPYVL